jgi:hypothetical protein
MLLRKPVTEQGGLRRMDTPDLKEIIKKLKAETGIVFSADLVYQALRYWLRQLQRQPKSR